MRPILQTVDAAYSVGGDESTWLDGVLASMQGILGSDRGVCALAYEIGPEGPRIHSPTVVCADLGMGRAIGRILETAITRVDHEVVARAFRAPRRPLQSTSEMLGNAAVVRTFASEAAAPMTVGDFVGGRVQRSDDAGYIVGALTGAPVRLDRRQRGELTRLFAHLEAAARLRGAGRPIATISRGRATNITDDAVRESLPELHRIHAHMTASRAGKTDLGGWSSRVDARYTLVPTRKEGEAEVVTNGIRLPGLEGEDPRVQGVARLLAEGHPQKLIAYELGIPEGSVYRHVARLKRLFGETTTVGLVTRLGATRPKTGERQTAREHALSALSPAERFAVEGALRGLTAAEMGKARGVSVRTAENVLRGAYQKLAVGSRKELAAKLG
ncbi:MAG: hypothetical protein HOO96_17975 [Polyangiaceae bacterium]|nr:hypothetical protein [Polyangiaceae bacterium]